MMINDDGWFTILWDVDGNLPILQENVGCSAGLCHPVSALRATSHRKIRDHDMGMGQN
jgi:hypothetical protein